MIIYQATRNIKNLTPPHMGGFKGINRQCNISTIQIIILFINVENIPLDAHT